MPINYDTIENGQNKTKKNLIFYSLAHCSAQFHVYIADKFQFIEILKKHSDNTDNQSLSPVCWARKKRENKTSKEL